MTIKEIASESGYGVGTVSRVINNNGSVSDKARARIMKVIEEHNYQPNENAKRLKIQSHYGIAVIVKGRSNALFESVIERMHQAVQTKGYQFIPYYIDQDDNEVEKAREILNERNPYGIIFLGSNLEFFNKDYNISIPSVIVTADASELNLKNVSSVSVDDLRAASFMTDYLLDLGHKNIGVIGGNPDLSRPSSMRLIGVNSSFIKHRMNFDVNKNYAYGRFSLRGGYMAARDLIKKFPDLTAIIAMSDLMAIGAIRALNELGKKCPEDISVTGFDGIEIADYTVPGLTTIRQDADRLALRSVEILINSIENGTEAVHEIVPYILKTGESTGKV
jgi:LacI family transcriptional regulator